jgi:predicted nuclease with RNAse H fold
MLTAGVDLAAQPAKTGLVVIDWESAPPVVTHAARSVTDGEILRMCGEVAATDGRVGIDCPLGWPRAFVGFVGSHAGGAPVPDDGPGTESLRLRATDLAVRARLGRNPLSVSTSFLGVTAFRAARLLRELADGGTPVDRSGRRGLVCEVYPAASAAAWGLTPKKLIAEAGYDMAVEEIRSQVPLRIESVQHMLRNDHVYDALLAAMTARAVTLGLTDAAPAHQRPNAEVEGWIHVPSVGATLRQLANR